MTSDELKNELTYNPESGAFIWARPGHGRSVNNPAGDSNGVAGRRISLQGRKWRTTTLAWLYMTGSLPEGVVIQRDQNVRNDRWDNLTVISLKEYRAFRRRQIVAFQDAISGGARTTVTKPTGVYKGPATWTEAQVRQAIAEFISTKGLTRA